MPNRPRGDPRGDQRWQTFLQNHAHAIVACDFSVVVTATFRFLYVLVIIEHGSRRLLHCNTTQHPTAEWTRQQFREAVPSDHQYRYLIHDRDSIFSADFDRSIENYGMRVLKLPYRSPKANSICERAIGSMRRECLDYMIPLTESHLRRIPKLWAAYYNQSRPHTALGPGFYCQGLSRGKTNEQQTPYYRNRSAGPGANRWFMLPMRVFSGKRNFSCR